MNISIVILSLWFLESSCGNKLIHPDKASHGHLGIKDIVIQDLNDRAGYIKWTAEDCMDKHKSFRMAQDYFHIYSHPEWSMRQYFLLWRCGPKGRLTPTLKQKKYAIHGVSVYKQICSGTNLKKLK